MQWFAQKSTEFPSIGGIAGSVSISLVALLSHFEMRDRK
jgi:hypothetical protein